MLIPPGPRLGVDPCALQARKAHDGVFGFIFHPRANHCRQWRQLRQRRGNPLSMMATSRCWNPTQTASACSLCTTTR